ncbi:patatin-like phospholipase family protein [Christiangramia sediminis]|uniref:Patatin-like phospholipase family protein n=1 Tax=Christiangramia sediminis TaxID=2881336 RepID=A0A9X1LIM6_9FLAO|nr:patatin-like phospholipase family protein [Christiangramia sediminis]MCB7481043.1 patatin-like phospholipase family protein [Christiangramia sediminis]
MNIGLVLSGGGARGVAQIGFIKALEEYGINITHISGTSAGAIIGAMYASGASWERILGFFKSVPIFHYKRYARNKPGFIDTAKFHQEFLKFFTEDNFSILQKKLYVNTTNLIDGNLRIFETGELINPLLASASIPGIFTPVQFKKGLFADGGIVNNFPVEPLQASCDKIIGGYVNPLKNIHPNGLKHSYQVITRAYQISLDHQCLSKFKYCDIMFCPGELENYGIFSLKTMDKIFNIGYMEAKKVLEEKAPLFIENTEKIKNSIAKE